MVASVIFKVKAELWASTGQPETVIQERYY